MGKMKCLPIKFEQPYFQLWKTVVMSQEWPLALVGWLPALTLTGALPVFTWGTISHFVKVQFRGTMPPFGKI